MDTSASEALNYRASGVDIDEATRAKELIKKRAKETFTKGVLTNIGFFGAMYELGKYNQPVLVSSTDGVGTKLKIAAALEKYDTVGIDLVNHCVNDIFTCGATPLFFLDYIAVGKLIPHVIDELVKGLVIACKQVNCALIGGETAEMPGVYQPPDFDLAGFIIGVVEKDGIKTGETIREGDCILGIPSSGLHTNGYSLARKIFGTEREVLNEYKKELGATLGEVLLKPHRCYYSQLRPLLPAIKGLAHITGGGLVDNIPRIMPSGTGALFYKGSWDILPIFKTIQKLGNINDKEMFRVFNMGIGMVIVCDKANVTELRIKDNELLLIGEVVARDGVFFTDKK